MNAPPRPAVAGLLVALAAAGCATQKPAPEASRGALWKERRTLLACLDHWRLEGKLALAAKDEGWSANLDWRQNGEAFEMQLSGPFGWGGLRLAGDQRHVVVRDGDEVYRFAGAPEGVIRRQFGMTIPVAGLRYWVRGTPRPESAAVPKLDRYGRLSRLDQSGWTIRYRSYVSRAGPDLPERLVMTRPDVRLKLVVDDWKIERDGGSAASCPAGER